MEIKTNPYQWAKSEPLPVKPAAKKPEELAAETRKDRVELSARGNEKLSAEELKGINEVLTAQQTALLKSMAGNTINQASTAMRALGQASLPGMKDLPPLATTQEGAAAAIAQGGAYSVDAVATRIFDMAKSFAGDDPEMLAKMRTAVEKGFSAAGMDFKRATGSKLPDISNRTYDEVMQRFDDLAKELSGAVAETKPGIDKKA